MTKLYYRYPPLFYICILILSLILIRVVLGSSRLSWDEAEQVFLAQSLSLGYPSQPPLYSWLQWMSFKTFGVNMVSLAVLKFGLLGASVWVYHSICRIYCSDERSAWCATCLWILTYPIGYELLSSRTHSVLALLASCLTWYWVIRPKGPVNAFWYLGLGVIVSIGLLSKFSYLLFLPVLMLSLLLVKPYRERVFSKGMILTALMAVMLTHMYGRWLIDHPSLGLYSSYKLMLPGQTTWDAVQALLLSGFPFIVLPLLLIVVFFPYCRVPSMPQSAATRLLGCYHLIVMPFLLLMVLAFGVHGVKNHWLIPVFFLFPLWVFGFVDQQRVRMVQTKRFIGFCLGVLLVFVALWVVRSHVVEKKPVVMFAQR